MEGQGVREDIGGKTRTVVKGGPQTSGKSPGLREGIRVLLADSSASIRQSAGTLLSRHGCRVTGVADGFEVLCQLEEVRPEIVFLETDMPRLDGFQTCALLRSSPQWEHAAVVLFSTGEPLDQVRAELCGAHRSLPKPFRAEELLRVIRELVGAPAVNDSGVNDGGIP